MYRRMVLTRSIQGWAGGGDGGAGSDLTVWGIGVLAGGAFLMISLFSVAVLLSLGLSAVGREVVWRFGFTGEAGEGFTAVKGDEVFEQGRGFGFLKGGEGSRVFGVAVEEGNYEVTVRLGDAGRATETTVRAEARRLMLHGVKTGPGEWVSRSFTVNVKRPGMAGGGSAAIDGREKGAPGWDDLLSLEWTGSAPGLVSVEIRPAVQAVTVFLAGDSTVTDQPWGPYLGWGQMLPRFFGPGVAVSNHAQSGLALFSFERQRRLQKLLSMMRRGDYVFIQFGHNDQKDKSEGAGPFTSYKGNLKRYVAAVREKGGLPVLVTSMERRRWKGGVVQTTLGEYAAAVRETAAEEGVPLIDLHAMSVVLYGALGEAGSKRAFVHYPANTFPGRPEALADDSHHSAYGGYELARCVVEGIRKGVPELAGRLAEDAGRFDPAVPDDPARVDIPLGALDGPLEKPAGN